MHHCMLGPLGWDATLGAHMDAGVMQCRIVLVMVVKIFRVDIFCHLRKRLLQWGMYIMADPASSYETLGLACM
jgi:hypothetical protein